MLPREEYLASKQAFRASAAVLCRDDQGQVLVLRTTYKPNWEIPGGAVEVGESPAQTVTREALEELQYEIRAGRLLCVDHVAGSDRPRGPMLHFIFDGGVIPPGAVFRLAADEIAQYRFVPLPEAVRLTGPGLGRRLTIAAQALDTGDAVYVDDGRRMDAGASA